MLALIFDPTLAIRVIMPILSVITGVGMVVAGISVGVIISKLPSNVLQDTKIVVQSPGTIVLNRFIEPNEIPFFYDAVDTLGVFLENIKKVLKAKFGENFFSVHIDSFSPTPNVTSSNSKQYISRRSKSLLVETLMMNSFRGVNNAEVNSQGTTDDQTTYKTTEYEMTPINHQSPHSTESTVVSTTAITTKITTATITTPVTNKNTTSQCNTPQNGTGHPSIVFSKLLISFVVKRGESILVEDIVDALKDLKPPIVLLTKCLESSSQTSSFNTTLSKVEPPVKVDIDLTVLENQPSIPQSLQDSVKKAASAALENSGLLSTTTTVASVT